MAVLGATNLTGCNSIPDFIPTGTLTTFAQAAAPTSWTRNTTDTANNRMLRVVSSGNGGVVGGSASPILNDVVPAHTHSFSTGNQSASHTHTFNTGNVSANHTHVYTDPRNGAYHGFSYDTTGNTAEYVDANTGTTGGISVNHTHSGTTAGISADHTHSGSTDNGSSQTNWAPRYVDLLLCSKN
jgi:hypothetical protein